MCSSPRSRRPARSAGIFDKSIDNFEANNGIIEQGYEGILSAPAEQHPKPFEIVFETPHLARRSTSRSKRDIRAVQTILDRFKVLDFRRPREYDAVTRLSFRVESVVL